MRLTSIFISSLSVCAFNAALAHAAAIPFRRIRINPAIPAGDLDAFKRLEMIRRDVDANSVEPESQSATKSVITLVGQPTASASSADDFTTTSSSTPSPSSSSLPTSESASAESTTSAPSSAPSSQSSQPPSSPNQKYVVAHHMVGNTFPYTTADWSADIALAHASGIDGFALNMGSDDWQPARVADAYAAAQKSNLDFKMFLSLDMSSLPCASPSDASALRSLVSTYFSHPNQLQLNNKAFVSTFAGESCTFGSGSPAQGWESQFTANGEVEGKMHFVPAFFVDPKEFSQGGSFENVIDGDFNWNSGWPIQLTTSFAENIASSQQSNNTFSNLLGSVDNGANASLAGNVISALSGIEAALGKFIGSTETDDEHLAALDNSGTPSKRDGSDAEKKTYMAAVSPWFFTHYGKDTFNKNFLFLSDQHLYAKRWESLIAARDKVDVVEVLTWNDYGESHYIGPIEGAQPNSQAWTDGMNHTAWLPLTAYYAAAFKSGSFPAIQNDQIYMWSRTHAASAEASGDGVGRPDNFELVQDAVWAVVLTTEPSTVTLSTSSSDQGKTFDVPAGLSKLSIPISPGGTMRGTIERGGKTVVQLAPSEEEFVFRGETEVYNFNAFVASASS